MAVWLALATVCAVPAAAALVHVAITHFLRS